MLLYIFLVGKGRKQCWSHLSELFLGFNKDFTKNILQITSGKHWLVQIILEEYWLAHVGSNYLGTMLENGCVLRCLQ